MSEQIDTDELATKIAQAITPVISEYLDQREPPTEGDGLTEAEVIALINEHASGGDGLTEARIIELITEFLPDDIGDGAEGLGDLGDALRLAFDPEHIDEMATGAPDGSQHSSTGWGPMIEAEQRCHLRGAVVDADERGTVTFRFYELADGDMDTDIADEPYRTRKIEVYGGEQYIPLEVTLDEGYYFIEKDKHIESGSDDVVPLRRSTGVEPEDVNGSDAPINWIRGWHPDYRESVDENAYSRFMSNEWYSNLHYLFLAEVGYSETNTDENAG